MSANSPSSDPHRSRVRRRKRRRIVVVVVLAAIATLWFGRNRVVAPALLAAARPWIENRAGLTVTVDSFKGRWIHGIELRGLRIRPAEGASSPVRAVQLERVSARYRLAELIRNGIAGLERVEAADGVVDLDLATGAAATSAPSRGWPDAAIVPEIDLRRVDLSIGLGNDIHLAADTLSIEMHPDPRANAGSPRSDGIAVAVETARLFVGRADETGAEEPWFDAPTATTLHYAPEDAFPLRIQDLRVRGSTWVSYAGLDPGGWNGNPWISTDLGTGLGNGFLGIGIGPGEVFVRTDVFRLDLGRLRDRVAGVSPWIPDLPTAVASLSVTCKAEITIPGSGIDGVDGEFDLDLRSRQVRAGPLLLDGQVDGARAAGAIADGVVSISTGTVRLSSAVLTVSNLQAPLPGLEAAYPIERIEGHWRMATRDVCDVLLGRTRFRSDLLQRLRPIRLDMTGSIRKGRITVDEAVAAARPAGAEADVFAIRTATPAWVAFVDDTSGALAVPRYEAEIACECADIAAVLPDDSSERFGGQIHATISAAGTGATVTGGFRAESPDATVAPAPPIPVAATGSWQASGTERGWSIGLEHASIGDGDASLALASPMSLGWSGEGGLHIDPSKWEGPPGRVRIEIERDDLGTRVAVRGDGLRPQLVVPDLLPTGLAVDDVSGAVTLVVGDRRWVLDGAVQAGRIILPGDDEPSRAEIAARVSPGRADDVTVRIERAGQRVADLAAAFPLPPFGPGADLDADCRLEGRIALTDLADLPWLRRLSAWVPSGRMEADVDVDGTIRAPRGTIRVAAVDLAVEGEIDGEPARFGPATVDGVILVADGLRIERFRVDAPGGSAGITGRAGDDRSIAALIREPGSGAFDEVPVDFDGRMEIGDLGVIPLARGGFVRRLAGRLEGTIRITGTAGDPALEGAVTLHNGGAGFQTGLPPLTGADAEIRFDPAHVITAEGSARLGGAPVDAEVRLDLATEPCTVDAMVRGENVLLVRDVGLRVRGDIDLRLRGPVDGALLDGRILLQQAEYTRPIGFLNEINAGRRPSPDRLHLFSLSYPLLAGLRFDVELQASTSVRISNNVLRSRVRPYLVLGGTGRNPALSGSVWLGPSRVSLPGAALDIESGSIVFDEADPLRPRLDLLGRASLHGYEVTVAVSGSYPDPQIDVSSMPPLPREDALLMLLNGQPPAHGIGAPSRAVVTPALLRYLGSGWFLNRVDQEGRSSSLLDRFEMEFDRNAADGGSETAEYRFRLAPERAFERPTSWHLVTTQDPFGRMNLGLRLGIRYPWNPSVSEPDREDPAP